VGSQARWEPYGSIMKKHHLIKYHNRMAEKELCISYFVVEFLSLEIKHLFFWWTFKGFTELTFSSLGQFFHLFIITQFRTKRAQLNIQQADWLKHKAKKNITTEYIHKCKGISFLFTYIFFCKWKLSWLIYILCL